MAIISSSFYSSSTVAAMFLLAWSSPCQGLVCGSSLVVALSGYRVLCPGFSGDFLMGSAGNSTQVAISISSFLATNLSCSFAAINLIGIGPVSNLTVVLSPPLSSPRSLFVLVIRSV